MAEMPNNEHDRLKQVGKWLLKLLADTWGAPAAKAAIVPIATLAGIWWLYGKTFLVGAHKLPGWAIAASMAAHLFAAGFFVRWAWQRRHRPRWYTSQDLRWTLSESFFRKGEALRPELEGDLGQHIRGPFCSDEKCKREIPVRGTIQEHHPDVTYFRCLCGQEYVVHFEHDTYPSEKVSHALRIDACRQAQAARRRKEI